MKKILSLALAAGFCLRAFGAGPTVINGGFESGPAASGCTNQLYQYASPWHGLLVEYYNGACNSSTNYIDYYPTGSTYPHLAQNCVMGPAYAGSRYAYSLHYESGQGSPNKNFNALIYQQMSNAATAGITYRATAYVKAYSGYGVQDVIKIGFINTSVGSSANALAANLRYQATQPGAIPAATYTSVGNGWYKLTANWTPSQTGTYYIVIGYLSLCTDLNNMSSTWMLDEVSVTCKADAGPDRVNTKYDACCSQQGCSSVSLGTPALAGHQYHWTPCNGTLLPGCSSAQPTANPCVTTTYTVTVSGPYCVTGRDEVKVTTNSWICCNPSRQSGEGAQGNTISIYPNPSDGEMIIESADPIQSITITDLSGKVILTRTGIDVTRASVDLSAQPKGIYLVRVMQNGVESHEKIMIE